MAHSHGCCDVLRASRKAHLGVSDWSIIQAEGSARSGNPHSKRIDGTRGTAAPWQALCCGPNAWTQRAGVQRRCTRDHFACHRRIRHRFAGITAGNSTNVSRGQGCESSAGAQGTDGKSGTVLGHTTRGRAEDLWQPPNSRLGLILCVTVAPEGLVNAASRMKEMRNLDECFGFLKEWACPDTKFGPCWSNCNSQGTGWKLCLPL